MSTTAVVKLSRTNESTELTTIVNCCLNLLSIHAISCVTVLDLKIMFDLTSHLNYKQPPAKKPKQTYTGVGQYTNLFEKTAPPPPTQHFETPYDRKKMMLEQLEKLSKEKNDLMAADWDPHSNQKATG